MISRLQGGLKLTPVHIWKDGGRILFDLSAPIPDLDYLLSQSRSVEGVADISCEATPMAIDVHRPGEELEAVLNGVRGLERAVEIHVLTHARVEELREHLEDGPEYHVLHLIAHGNPFGALLLEEGRGWARFVGAGELAETVGDRVQLFVLGACHGGRIAAGLTHLESGARPAVMVFAQGEYPVPTRAIHLFSERFYRTLARGESSSEAFRKGVEKVRRDDVVGEVACPDGVSNDGEPSPFKRLRITKGEPISFTALSTGNVVVRDLQPDRPIHRRTIPSTNLLLGRETAIARLMEELLPPKVGIREPRSPLINLHGEGGIGKTRLGQAVCDSLEDYRFFQGGIYEIDAEPLRDMAGLALAVLKALGVEGREAGPDPVAALPRILRQISDASVPVLIMLDNVDPLFPGSSAEEASPPSLLIKSMLAECPSLRILTTCRTMLYLGGYESDFLVDPIEPGPAELLFMLSIPDPDVRNQVLALPGEGKAHLERLISALEGHPLCIFLAAHRIGAGPDPVATQLAHAHQDLVALADDPKLAGLPARQRSLRASLDLSFARLSERARAFLPRAGLFPGGLYRHVSTLDDLLGPNWREDAEECTGLGLLRFEREEQRYRMLNPVREYAEELLGEPGLEFRGKVARHWPAFAATNDLLLNPAQNPEFMARLDLPTDEAQRREFLARLHKQACAAFLAEEANILFAFQWAVEHDFEPAEQIATGLMDYLTTYDKRQTNAWVAEKTMDRAKDTQTKAKWLGNLGNRLSALGDREGAKEKAEEAVGIRRDLAKKHPEAFLPDLAMSLNNLGNSFIELGDEDAALECFRSLVQVGELYAKVGSNPAPLVQAHRSLAGFLTKVKRNDEAIAQLEKAVGILEPIAERHPAALQDLVAVNEERLNIAKALNSPGVEELAQKIADQKRRLQELLGKSSRP